MRTLCGQYWWHGNPHWHPAQRGGVGFIRSAGIEVSFVTWMQVAIPLAFGLLFFAWLLLWFMYKPEKQGLEITLDKEPITGRGWFVISIFIITILLWFTEELHGLPSAVTALVPAIAFTATGLLDRSDVDSLEWHILLLIAGGIALGVGLQVTKLDSYIVSLIPSQNQYVFAILLVSGLVLSIFMSNTAAANLIIPIGISVAMSDMVNRDFEIVLAGMGIALATSLAMALPISTPPNALAYAKNVLKTKDFIVAGSIIGIVGILFVVFGAEHIIRFWTSF
ncbi:MAG: hypothetical protein HC842_03055 [Cytophagales bacterium]|nr:hypothetical protein [Cytophagales bacterium]